MLYQNRIFEKAVKLNCQNYLRVSAEACVGRGGLLLLSQHLRLVRHFHTSQLESPASSSILALSRR